MDQKEIQDNIDLSNLVAATSQDLIKDRENSIRDIVRKVFMKEKGLIEEINKLEKEATKKRESLKQTQDKLDKVRKGDWAVLVELEKEFSNKKDNQNNQSESTNNQTV